MKSLFGKARAAIKGYVLVLVGIEMHLLLLPFSLCFLSLLAYDVMNIRIGEIVKIVPTEEYYVRGKGLVAVDYGKVKSIRRFSDVYVLGPIVNGSLVDRYTYHKERSNLRKLSKKEKLKFYLDSL